MIRYLIGKKFICDECKDSSVIWRGDDAKKTTWQDYEVWGKSIILPTQWSIVDDKILCISCAQNVKKDK